MKTHAYAAMESFAADGGVLASRSCNIRHHRLPAAPVSVAFTRLILLRVDRDLRQCTSDAVTVRPRKRGQTGL